MPTRRKKLRKIVFELWVGDFSCLFFFFFFFFLYRLRLVCSLCGPARWCVSDADENLLVLFTVKMQPELNSSRSEGRSSTWTRKRALNSCCNRDFCRTRLKTLPLSSTGNITCPDCLLVDLFLKVNLSINWSIFSLNNDSCPLRRLRDYYYFFVKIVLHKSRSLSSARRSKNVHSYF